MELERSGVLRTAVEAGLKAKGMDKEAIRPELRAALTEALITVVGEVQKSQDATEAVLNQRKRLAEEQGFLAETLVKVTKMVNEMRWIEHNWSTVKDRLEQLGLLPRDR